ncbi:MAG: hypothetical protein MK135_11550, partial [Polyangiaceae bacterium]|nr:hypothetical protein [Polyangiaceae bacterium]
MARALAVEPANEVVLESLQRLALGTERFADLGATLETQVESLDDPELQNDLLMAAARVFEDSVGDADKAISV